MVDQRFQLLKWADVNSFFYSKKPDQQLTGSFSFQYDFNYSKFKFL